jgi:hypothetical protein
MRGLIQKSATLLALMAVAIVGAAAPPMPHQAPGTSLGAASCASSTCHGAVTPWNASNVLQNEYTTWGRLDPHSQAYNTLLNDASKRIAKNLGLQEPAHQAKICLDCHAHNPSASQRGDRFQISDGVSCEACHGPSDRWIASHTVKGVSHSENLKRGLYPSSRPADQARLCLSCHFGDSSRFVTHRIMGAGHPRMSFEITTFAALTPAHYRVDRDYVERKGPHEPIRLWAIGQAIAAKTFLDTLADPKRNRDGLFPELVLFDCHACHRSMGEKRWVARHGLPPGVIRLNDSSLLMVRALTLTVDPQNSAAFDAAISALHRSVLAGGTATASTPAGRTEDLALSIAQSLDRLVLTLEKTNFDHATQRRMLMSLIEESRAADYSDYAGAEQAYMALLSLANGLARDGNLRVSEAMRASFQRMKELLSNEDRYQHSRFLTELASLRQAVSADQRSAK